MSRKLVKTSKYVKPYYEGDENLRRKVRLRIENYLEKPEISQDKLAEQLTELLGVEYTRKPAAGLAEFLGYPKKDKKLFVENRNRLNNERFAEERKVYRKNAFDKYVAAGGSEYKFKNEWKSFSYLKFKEQYGISQYEAEAIGELFELGRKGHLYTYEELYEDLIEAGETDESIEDVYLNQMLTMNEINEKYEALLNKEIGTKRLSNLMEKKLNLYRTRDQVKFLQGKASRRILAENLARLERAGYTVETLASEYEKDRSLTKHGVVRKLNSTLRGGEPRFTSRWLARYIDPLLPKERLGGVSRSELEFTRVLQEAHSELELVTSCRSLIPPQEVDIYIPELKIGIEFNGDYWHSDRFMVENHNMTAKEYHEDKLRRCQEIGVTLLFVWESDWVDHDNLVLFAIEKALADGGVHSILSKVDMAPLDEED